MIDPIVIDPPNFNIEREWAQHQKWVEEAGGLTHEDGEVNWRAAFSADPGICSCPACQQMYWAFGRRQRCAKCAFEYPTDWWGMYSYGVSAARGKKEKPYQHEKRMEHPYYRYGYEHPVDNAWEESKRIDWKEVMTR